MTKSILAGLLLAAASFSAPAMAAETVLFNFNSSSGGIYSSTTVNGEQVKARVSAWQFTPDNRGDHTINGSNYDLNSASLGRWDQGFGVTGRNDGGSNEHTIDNYKGFDFIVLQFDQEVSLDRATLSAFSVNGSKDNDAVIGYGLTDLSWLSTPGLNTDEDLFGNLFSGFYDIDGTGSSSYTNINPDGFTGNIWLIGAKWEDFSNSNSRGGNRNKDYDGFKFDNLKVTTIDPVPGVPEPSTWAMMLAGFGLVGYGLRRRPAQRRVAA